MQYIFDLSKLRGRIREICGTEEIWGKLMGFSKFTQNSRLNGKSYFKTNEIMHCCQILKISHIEIDSYFFSIVSSENKTIL